MYYFSSMVFVGAYNSLVSTDESSWRATQRGFQLVWSSWNRNQPIFTPRYLADILPGNFTRHPVRVTVCPQPRYLASASTKLAFERRSFYDKDDCLITSQQIKPETDLSWVRHYFTNTDEHGAILSTNDSVCMFYSHEAS